jgi:hypothetical protein
VNVQDLVVEIHQALTTKQRLAMLRHVHQVISSSRSIGGNGSNASSSSSNDDDDDNNNHGGTNQGASSFFLWLLEAGTLDALILQLNFVLHRGGGGQQQPQRHHHHHHGGGGGGGGCITIVQEVVDLCRVLALFLRTCPNHGPASHLALIILSSSSRQQQSRAASAEQHPRGRAAKAAGGSDFMQLLSHAYQQWPAARLHVLAILHAVSGREKGTELVLQSRDVLLRVVDSLRHSCSSVCSRSSQDDEQEHQQQHSSHRQHEQYRQQHDHYYNSTYNQNDDNDSTTNSNALLQTLGILKNLSYFSKNSCWNILVDSIPGFLKALTSLTQQQRLAGKSRERLSAIWRNFAVAQSSGSGGGRGGGLLTRHASVVSSICSLVMNTNSNNNNTTNSDNVDNNENDDNNVAVHRNFLTILVSLSMDMESSLLLMLHGDGIMPNHILQRLLLQSPDALVRKRAARTIRQWASHDSTGALLVHCPGLLHAISHVAHSDESSEVRHEAGEALSRCAAWISAPMPQQQAVLDALACLCQVSSSVSVIARALKGQAAHVNNRLLLVSGHHHNGQSNIFVNALTSIALESSSPSIARADACCALCDLAAEVGNRRRLLILKSCSDDNDADGENEINHQLLEALRVNVLSSIPGGRRDYAAQALVYLAENDVENRRIMVQHAQLLQALIQYAATSDNSLVMKHHVKRVILQMVQEL